MSSAVVAERRTGRGGVVGCLMVLGLAAATRPALADDWGAYAIIPMGAPGLVLEAVGSGDVEGTVVTIGRPAGTPNQKWNVVPRGNGRHLVRSTTAPGLVVAAARGGTANGTPIVLEADRGDAWQEWSLGRHDDGSYGLVPAHAPGMGLDHFGGKVAPGARIDLWENAPGDSHLRWLIRPLAGSPDPAPSALAPPSTYVAPAVGPAAVPRGQIRSFTFDRSLVFPGTTREVTVFIPAQADGSAPACVYVRTDGYDPAEKPVIEEMIAAGEMPTTVGVFFRPGEVPAPALGTIGRRNRGFEYDGLGDNLARFLVDELLPEVARRFDLKLSTSGNDRCMAGSSSGGIAAFNAAWARPDEFRRVYATSGSFVAFRGGHEFPTLVRKTEAKPIRAFLTTGTRDMENAAGDWTLVDREMAKALDFSGYDAVFRTIDGGHGAGHHENFREAMSFLWRGWPEPVRAGATAPRVRDIIIPGEGWAPVAADGRTVRGLVGNSRGEVFFADGATDQVHRIGLDGTVGEFRADAGGADALTVGPNDDLIAASSRTGRVTRIDPTGRASPVVDGLRGSRIAAHPDGGFHLVGRGADEPPGAGATWFVRDGARARVDSGLKRATGLAYRPDGWLLAGADGGSRWVYSYQIRADGTLGNKERYFALHVPDGEDDAGAEAICYAREGQLFVATRLGIQVCADDGPTQVILPLPGAVPATEVCLGGPGLDTLFAVGGDRIWRRRVRVHGTGAFAPRTAVRASPL